MKVLLACLFFTTVSCIQQKAGNPAKNGATVDSSFSMPVQYSMAAPLSHSPTITPSKQTDITFTSTTVSSQNRISRPFNVYQKNNQVPPSYNQYRRNPYPPELPVQSTRPYNNNYNANHFHQPNQPSQQATYSSHVSRPPNQQHPVFQHYSTTHQHHYYPHNSHPVPHSSPSYAPPHSNSHHHHPPPPTSELLELMSPLRKEDAFFPPSGIQPHPSSLYGLLVPLVLLGISIPAIGFMYTYLSRRSFQSTIQDYIQPPSADDLSYYYELLQRGIKCFQSPTDCS